MEWNIVQTYIDEGISGSKGRQKRPGFNSLLNGVLRREFDLIAAWSVDQLGRSLQGLVGFLNDINNRNVDLYLHQQRLDTSTPSGRAMFGMLSVFSEFERSMISGRVKSGLERVKASGKKLGRPTISAKKVQRIKAAVAEGKWIHGIAIDVGILLRLY